MAITKSLNFFAQIYGPLGIPNHSRDFARALSKKVNLSIIPIAPRSSNYDIDESITKHIKRVDKSAPGLMFWYPHEYSSVLGIYPKNIGYYIFEYTKIPKLFIENINTLDAICTASKWGVEVLKNNGVKVPCYIIPGGVSEKFNSNLRKPSGTFKFLNVGKLEVRKGTETLIKAFINVFGNNKNVELILSIDNIHGVDKELQDRTNVLINSVNNIKRISFITNIKTLYDSSHCAVFPTLAEGIGLPITECLGTGIPVIVNETSGVTEYANDNNSILLKRSIDKPIFDKLFFPEEGSFGTWRVPNIEELQAKMVWVYNNYDQAIQIGKNAEEYIKNNYTWDKSAEKFKEELL